MTVISIHALREEGDVPGSTLGIPAQNFYPRPPRGGRHGRAEVDRFLHTFYPRPPRGGRQEDLVEAGRISQISIHALREEGDEQNFLRVRPLDISIHALREEGDRVGSMAPVMAVLFLSTPSARRATTSPSPASLQICYFYPRPPRGGRRLPGDDGMMLASNFYPRPPRGGRPKQSPAAIGFKIFLSTPSARRATIFHEDADTALMISIHALREEGRPFSQQGFAVVGISIHALREEGDPCFVAQPLFQQISIHALREEGDPGRPRNGHDRGHFYPRPPRGGRQES